MAIISEQFGIAFYRILFMAIFIAGLYFNFTAYPKPSIMYQNYLNHTNYKFFPWEKPSEQKTSKSHPIWLIVHIYDAFYHVFLTGMHFIKRHPDDIIPFKISHWVFVTIIGVNLIHAGDLSPIKAIVFNGIPWVIALITFDPENKVWYKSLIYFVAISSAIIFETVMYMIK